jgi:hypothetical protein
MSPTNCSAAPLRLALPSLLLALASAAPFTPGSVAVVRVGGRAGGAAPLGHSAEPVFVDEVSRGAVPRLLQSVALPAAAFALSAIDEREGDLDTDSTGCALTLMGYALPADGRDIANSGLCPCTKDLAVAIVDAEGRVDASTRWNVTGNGGGGPGYVRANGAQLRPDGLLYAFAGRSAGCFVDLLRPGFAYQNDAAAPPPVGGLRAEIVGGNSGFSARGLQIAGREEGRLQLFAGSGAGLFRLGDGLPDAGPVEKIYVLHPVGGNEGGSFDFMNDTAVYVVDEDVNASDRTLHRYLCTPAPGASDDADDQALQPCPEGGSWRLDESFDVACVVGGEEQSLWYIAGVYGEDPERPVIVASTHGRRDNSLDDVGSNMVVELDTRSGICRVLLPPLENSVYRGVSLSPDSSRCADFAPTATATATATSTGTSTSSRTSTSTSTRTATATSTAAAAAGAADSSSIGGPAATAATAVGAVLGVLALAGAGVLAGRRLLASRGASFAGGAALPRAVPAADFASERSGLLRKLERAHAQQVAHGGGSAHTETEGHA